MGASLQLLAREPQDDWGQDPALLWQCGGPSLSPRDLLTHSSWWERAGSVFGSVEKAHCCFPGAMPPNACIPGHTCANYAGALGASGASLTRPEAPAPLPLQDCREERAGQPPVLPKRAGPEGAGGGAPAV